MSSKKGRTIGSGQPCFIIAEAGSNHNGSFDHARALIDVAKESGADAVKFQLFKARTLYPNKPVAVKYLSKIGIRKGLYDLIEGMEMPWEWVKPLSAYCREVDIQFLATPFDLDAVRILNSHVNLFKVASSECFDLELIEAVKKTGKDVVVSIGGCSQDEVDELMNTLLRGYESKTILLQCLSKYPAPINELQLAVIPEMGKRYGVRMGLSDHSANATLAPTVAVALGACVVEKHFTLSRRLPGPDHSFAIEPGELKEMVQAIRMAESSLGSSSKVVQPSERELVHYKRALYLKSNLPARHIIRANDFVSLRKTGEKINSIPPMKLNEISGRALKKGKKKLDILVWEDLA